MSLLNHVKTLLDRDGLRPVLVPVINHLAKSQGRGVEKVFYDDGVWMHKTSSGYFAYQQPYIRLNLALLDEAAKTNFLWGYQPRPGDVILDVGAGVGEETLTFCRAVGECGRVICVEAHPGTYRCLQKMIQYNGLKNAVALHQAAAEPSCAMVTIEDSSEYLGNRSNVARGYSVAATTIDDIHSRLALGRVDFLKMNIEGAERLAIGGMGETLRRTTAICISCHDFLAETSAGQSMRTKEIVRQFLSQHGFEVMARPEPGLPPYLRDQVWAYNRTLRQKFAA